MPRVKANSELVIEIRAVTLGTFGRCRDCPSRQGVLVFQHEIRIFVVPVPIPSGDRRWDGFTDAPIHKVPIVVTLVMVTKVMKGSSVIGSSQSVAVVLVGHVLEAESAPVQVDLVIQGWVPLPSAQHQVVWGGALR